VLSLQLAAAIFFQATEANQVKLTLEQVCTTLGAATSTAALRLRELRAALATVGQTLPWGRDITESSVKEHLPMILQLLRLSREVGSQDRALTEQAGSLAVLGGSRGAAGAIEAASRGRTKEEDNRSAENVAKQVTPVADFAGDAVPLHKTGAIGRSQNRKKRARDSDHRAGTPENVEVGPLGSYLKLRNTLSESPEKTAGSAGGGVCSLDREELQQTAQQTGSHGFRTPLDSTPMDLGSEARSLGAGEAGGVSGGSKLVEEPDMKGPVTDQTESEWTSVGKGTESPLGAIAASFPDVLRSDTSCDWKTESEPADLKGAPSLLPRQSVQQSGSLRGTSVQDSKGVSEGRESHRPLQPSSVSSICIIQQERAKICAPESRTPQGDSVDYPGRRGEDAGKDRVPPQHRQSDEIIDVFEPDYVNTPPLEHIDGPEIEPYPETLQVPEFVQTAANVQKPLTEFQHTASVSKQDEEVANKFSIVTVQPAETTDRDGVQKFPPSEVPGPGGEEFEAVPFWDWNGLPPSFRAQAIERQRCVLST
jgi:hypothetical protein